MKKIYIIAVVAALLSSVLIYGFLSSYDKKNGDGSVNYKTEKVVVALTDIPANTTVTDKMVKEVDMPVDGIHPKALPKIIAFDVPTIVYVSCKPTSLVRDREVLEAAAWK